MIRLLPVLLIVPLVAGEDKPAARPTKFESRTGDRVFLLVLKRVKE